MATSLQLTPRCGIPICTNRENLKFCAKCKAKAYCCQNHQKIDWPIHKEQCKTIHTAFIEFKDQERALRQHPEDPFNQSVGYFDVKQITRPYIEARVGYLNALIAMSTHESVRQALEHTLDLLRLGRSDSTGVRDVVPFLMLRLDKVEEAYDFAEWWTVVRMSRLFDWKLNSDPDFMNPKSDVFGSVVDICTADSDLLSGLIAITLVKVKLLIDFKELKRTDGLKLDIPGEILDCIRKHIPRCTKISNQANLISKGNWDLEIKTLYAQIALLKKKIHHVNPKFWTEFFDEDIPPEQWAPRHKCRCGPTGRADEYMQMVMGTSYKAWRETRGAVALVKSIPIYGQTEFLIDSAWNV